MLEISFYKNQNDFFKKITKYLTDATLAFINKIFYISFILIIILSAACYKLFGNLFVLSLIFGYIAAILLIFVASVITSKILSRVVQFYNESNLFILKQINNSATAISMCAIAGAIIPLTILLHITKELSMKVNLQIISHIG